MSRPILDVAAESRRKIKKILKDEEDDLARQTNIMDMVVLPLLLRASQEENGCIYWRREAGNRPDEAVERYKESLEPKEDTDEKDM